MAVAARTPLVGRERELGTLDALLSDVRSGPGRVLVVSGEPGIGKSRLLAELAVRATPAQRVLVGQAAEFESDRPFGVLSDALEAHVSALGRRELRHLAPEDLDELAAIMPELDEPGGGVRAAVAEERARTHRAVGRLLELLAEREPLALLLDDLHWADAATLELLELLLDEPPPDRLLLALAFRSGRAPARLERVLGAAQGRGIALRIELPPLGEREAAQLLESVSDPERAAAIRRVAGGNPFFLEQLARSAHRPRAGDDPAFALPPAVLHVIDEQVRAVAPRARRLLESAAVVGDPFDPALAIEVAELEPGDRGAAVAELRAAELVHPAGERLRFRHPIVRHAVYAGIAPGRRTDAHRRSGDALARRGAPAAECAHHVEHAALPGDAVAIELLARAARETEVRAPSAAARWLQAALSLGPPPELRLELLVRLALARGAIGELDQARAALLDSIALLPAGSPLRLRAIAACAGVERQLGAHSEARERVEAALASLEPADAPGRATLELELAACGAFVFDGALMRDAGSRALGLGRELRDRSLVAAAAALSGWGARMLGEDGWRELLDEAARAFDSASDEELAARLAAATYLGWAEFFADRPRAAADHFARGVEVARASGQGHALPLLLVGRVSALAMLGEVGEGLVLARSVLDTTRTLAVPQLVSWALLGLIWISTLAGDLATALAHVPEALELSGLPDESTLGAATGWSCAFALLEAGRADEARSLLLAHGGEELTLVDSGFRPNLLEVLTRANLELRDRDAAARTAGHAAAIAEQTGLDSARMWAGRAQAAVLLADGDAQGAASAARAAIEAGERSGMAVAAARARHLLAQALSARGDADGAVRELEAALRVSEASGAMRIADEAAAALRALGRRPVRRRMATGSGALSARELEVARLLASGRSQREIAQQLAISARTVEAHAARVREKLGARTRAQIAAALYPPPPWKTSKV